MARVKIQLEELFKSSPKMLYQFITDPACLVRWFCDEADLEADRYEFTWDGHPEMASLDETDEDSRIRFKWDDADDKEEYLEFKMYKAGVTDQTVLEVHDFCDDDEIDDSKTLWISQLKRLKQEIGG
ncbi:MAG: START-like domain-containing protein [Saprospiraceae bacterium]